MSSPFFFSVLRSYFTCQLFLRRLRGYFRVITALIDFVCTDATKVLSTKQFFLRNVQTKVQRRVRRLPKPHTVAYMDPQPTEGTISVSRREGIEWDPGTSPHILSSSCSSENMELLLPSWAQTLAKPLVAYRTPFIVSADSSTSFASGWDPLWKLKIRDAVCGDRKCFSSTPENFRLSPVVAKDGNNLVSLRNDVVRLWDTNAKTEVKRVYLPKRSSNANVNALTSAFDVDWDAKRAAVGGVDGSLSFIDLERSAFEKSYQMQQALVQALQFDRNSSTKTALVGRYSLTSLRQLKVSMIA